RRARPVHVHPAGADDDRGAPRSVGALGRPASRRHTPDAQHQPLAAETQRHHLSKGHHDSMTTGELIAPHGGALVNRFLDDHARARALEDASRLPSIQLTAVQHSDLLCIATGVFSPLTGFVRRADYESIVERMRLADGTIWTLPVTLAASSDRARQIGPGADVAFLDPAGSIVSAMDATE